MLATYGTDFYEGRPALTVNDYGRGRAYYIASRNDKRFLDDFYDGIAGEFGLRRVLDADLPEGVSAQMRTDGRREYVFLLNFTPEPQTVELGEVNYSDMLSEGTLSGPVEIDPYGVLILARSRPDSRSHL